GRCGRAAELPAVDDGNRHLVGERRRVRRAGVRARQAVHAEREGAGETAAVLDVDGPRLSGRAGLHVARREDRRPRLAVVHRQRAGGERVRRVGALGREVGAGPNRYPDRAERDRQRRERSPRASYELHPASHLLPFLLVVGQIAGMAAWRRRRTQTTPSRLLPGGTTGSGTPAALET